MEHKTPSSDWEAVSAALAKRAGTFAKASGADARAVVVVDSHTEGEPTRVVLAGAPDLGDGTPESRRQRFDQNHGAWRKGVVDEPRGSEAVVGALILPPHHPEALATVLFFKEYLLPE